MNYPCINNSECSHFVASSNVFFNKSHAFDLPFHTSVYTQFEVLNTGNNLFLFILYNYRPVYSSFLSCPNNKIHTSDKSRAFEKHNKSRASRKIPCLVISVALHVTGNCLSVTMVSQKFPPPPAYLTQDHN